MLSQDGVLLSTCLLACVTAFATTDLLRRRIPNVLTLPAAAAGLGLHLASGGSLGVLQSGAGLIVGLAVFLPFYLARGFGGGDVKAMAAVGAFLGPRSVLLAAALVLIAGAVGALVLLWSRAGLRTVLDLLRRWSWRLYGLAQGGVDVPIPPPEHDAALQRFPYGLAIACGTLACLILSAP